MSKATDNKGYTIYPTTRLQLQRQLAPSLHPSICPSSLSITVFCVVFPDSFMQPLIDSELQNKAMFVVKRPGVDKFLDRISRTYKVVVFTAGIVEYASQVLDKLDKNRVISKRLYRDSCKLVNGKYVKDLSLVGEDLGNVLIVDDTPSSYSLQPDNGVPIRPFVDDMKDRELMKLAEFFEGCHGYEDMRDAVNEFLAKRLI